MAVDTANLAALIGSRICHDLISPVGAINNGLELLAMSGAMAGPELELISDSVLNANARIRFFRIAFGAAGDQQMGRAEIVSVLDDISKAGRLKFQWDFTEGCNRSDVRMAFLAALCLESALPYGGMITMTCTDGKWSVSGEGRKINIDAPLWAYLDGSDTSANLTPAQVQFAMLPAAATQAERQLGFDHSDEKAAVWF
ncbi:histidine phosphotransferase family protein [Pseudophaeobacter arcticus]|uniref:histidine phosphotransferase family protein n=1 Tax=Pseudophaeobacter arcticus TaxID=385492 RepID=UPI000418535E|nr:histidine phosphotransferase family protein [Pseudophaeobacter arcticus]